MRYIGNKESILEEIKIILEEKNLLNNDLTFFDGFSGTATVSSFFSQYYNIVFCDNMYSSYVYSYGRLMAHTCTFHDLGFDPFTYFNSNEFLEDGFFSRNYSPQISGRMYFTDFNAGRIDYFRKTIEDWKNSAKVSGHEYNYLLCCLLESVSKVANVAGVYGAFLKKWDPRAQKKITFISPPVYHNQKKHEVRGFYADIEEINPQIDCDILYLDPPYTKNKYPVQYHILETLSKDDNPKIKGVTGARDNSNISTNWSQPNRAEISFVQIIAETRAKYILFSYSNDGIMTKDFITNVLKRYGKEDTFLVKEINYKKYRNIKTKNKEDHFEYLFYIEKKDEKDIRYICPLNYMGGKGTLLNDILKYVPKCETFYDIMGGGFNVGVNIRSADHIVYNDCNYIVRNLVELFKISDTYTILTYIEKTIKRNQLEKKNKEAFVKFRNLWNTKLQYTNEKYLSLYVLVMYGFQQQLRFNSKKEFNNTVGESGYNDSIKEKIISFSHRLKKVNCSFSEFDFEDLFSSIKENDVVYIDPPYLITLGSYNDGKRGFKGWTSSDENRLLNFVDNIVNKNAKVLISNVIYHRGNTNRLLKSWVESHNVKMMKYDTKGREEVLIIYG
ncbi:MAG: DNA adenine methylase [Treponema sp.]|nr:DNA adenine methylase [Treponema sp.]